jgi:putative ABC transport system permease protein
MNLEPLRMAVGGIAANKTRSALTMLGIMIGVAAVIILVAVGSGSAAASRKRLEALGSNTLTVMAGGFQRPGAQATTTRSVTITDGDVKALEDKAKAPSVAAVVASVNATGRITYEGTSTQPSQALGTSANFSEVRNFPLLTGSFFTQDDVDSHRKVVVLGTTTVKNLIGETGDLNSIIGQKIKYGSASFTVIGIFETKGSNGFQDQDDIAVVPMTTARDSLGGTAKSVNSLTVQATSRGTTDTAQTEITTILTSRHRGTTSSDFLVLNQASLQQTQDASNRTFTTLLGAVAAISLLVGGIGVMNIMLVTVTERTREIGIRKAIGARKIHLVTQFLTEAVLLSMIGGLLGIAAGLIGSRFTIVGTKPVVETYSVVLAFAVAVGVGLFFGLYPANRAAKLRPIEALRYE